jgi:hypothetical protein
MGGSVGSCKLPPNGIEVPLYVLSTTTMPMVHTQRNDIRARLDVGANMVSIDQYGLVAARDLEDGKLG